jgi:hypothetical protein
LPFDGSLSKNRFAKNLPKIRSSDQAIIDGVPKRPNHLNILRETGAQKYLDPQSKVVEMSLPRQTPAAASAGIG